MCRACSQPDPGTGYGYYCPGAPSGGREDCPAPFVFSDTGGNTGPAECYAKVTCGGRENKVTCKEWEVHAGQCKNDGSMPNDDTAKNVQWTYSKYNQSTYNTALYIKYHKRAQPLFYAEAVKPFGTNTALTDNSNNSGYHIEIRPDFSPNPTSASPWEASVTNLACVKNTIPCNEFGPESCAHQTTLDKCNAKRFCKWVENQCKSKKSICEAKTNSANCNEENEECTWLDNLVELNDDPSKCAYINDVAISSNNANGQIQTNLNANTTLEGYLYANHGNGNAEWNMYYGWNVSQCIGQHTNVSMDAHNCVGTQLHNPLDYEGDKSRPIKVWSTEESIIFANINSPHYYCTRCKGDDVNNNKYYYGDTTDSAYLTSDECYEDLAGDVRPKKTDGRVCKCTTVSDHGYYRTGQCNSDNNWTSENDICIITACPAGKTTYNLGPIVASATTMDDVCKYTKRTQFCDNTGDCTSLENQGGEWTFF